MKDLEPSIYRQRLIIEGHFKRSPLEGEDIRTYLTALSQVAQMRIFSGPYAWPPDRWDHPSVQLNDLNGFVAWTESGAHVYAWHKPRFFTVDIYSCKRYEVDAVLALTRDYFESDDLVFRAL